MYRTGVMPRVAEGFGQQFETQLMINAHCFFQLGHGFEVNSLVAMLPGKGKTLLHQRFAHTLATGHGQQIHFYQFANAHWQPLGGVNACASAQHTVCLGYIIGTARCGKKIAQVVQAFIEVRSARTDNAVLLKHAFNKCANGGVIFFLYGSDADWHSAK